jgi:hypothetical protein
MNKAHPTQKFLILLAITTLTISAMACNLSKLVIEPEFEEPRYEEEGQSQEREEFDEGDEKRSEGEHDEPRHGEEEFRDEEEEFHHEGEPHHDEECPPESECPGEPHHDEGEYQHEGEPHHEEEGEPHHEEDEFHHEGEAPQGEECPPESECPNMPGYGEESSIHTDLAVTDIFPENLPFGDLKLRITNHGPTPLTAYPAEVICHAHGISWGGPEHGQEDRESHQQIILSLGPGDTDEFEVGITIDANLYQYEVVCEVWTDIDPEHHNNIYMEMVPESNNSP